MARKFDRKIVLEDGAEYPGVGFGYRCDRVCEIVFNTSMAGYQELISDLSYTYQMVVMTYPLIGNYGIADDDFGTKTPTVGGLIVREYNDSPSNFRYTKTLSEILEENHIPAISEVDTRSLTRSIRDLGSRKVLITDIDTPHERAMEILQSAKIPHDAVAQVSCRKRWYARTSNHKFHVVAIDCGIKASLVRCLNAHGCNVTVMPWDTTAEEVEAMKPDGILLSNGPGDPADVTPVVELVRCLREKKPIFGVGLGLQIIALAYGAKTYQMKFGHHGSNQPVRNLSTGKVEITGQNHIYAVDAASLTGTRLTETHVNLLDKTVEGVACADDRVFAVQYYPDIAPGPLDSAYLYDQFIDMMREEKSHA